MRLSERENAAPMQQLVRTPAAASATCPSLVSRLSHFRLYYRLHVGSGRLYCSTASTCPTRSRLARLARGRIIEAIAWHTTRDPLHRLLRTLTCYSWQSRSCLPHSTALTGLSAFLLPSSCPEHLVPRFRAGLLRISAGDRTRGPNKLGLQVCILGYEGRNAPRRIQDGGVVPGIAVLHRATSTSRRFSPSNQILVQLMLQRIGHWGRGPMASQQCPVAGRSSDLCLASRSQRFTAFVAWFGWNARVRV